MLAAVFIYLGLSTIIYNPEYIGSVGYEFARVNREYFGYISFVYLFALLLPLYKIYSNSKEVKEVFETALSSMLLLLSLLILQALLVDGEFAGKIGSSVVVFLKPYLGSAGVWIFWLVTFIISLAIFFDKRLEEFFKDKFSKSNPLLLRPSKKVKKEKTSLPAKEVLSYEESVRIPQESVAPENLHSTRMETKETEKAQENQNLDEPVTLDESSKKEQKRSLITEIVDELEENKKLLETIEKGELEKPKDFRLPSTSLLQRPPKRKNEINESEIDEKIKELIEKLQKFKIEGDVVRTYTGPVVTTFEFKPAPHIKVSKILNLQDDLAMALKAQTIRIQAPVPGKDVVGIEIPNKKFETIYLREILEDELFAKAASPLTIALGKDIVGKPFVTDLKKLPHLLIAGTTGSGKSVGINSIIVSLLYRNSPENLRLLMIDPKMLEFSIYNDIPHLLTPVITKSKQAVVALNNMVSEMERRYHMMSQTKTKNIEGYNKKAKKEGMPILPYIIVTIDELADLMMTSGKEVEFSIARLAQMARAAGIHLIVATQRPSVDVVTGLIKANLPSRISFKVGQKIDSKVILDSIGAESLLGRGDMLFTPPGATGLIRLHAPWISENEVEKVVEFLKSQKAPEYDEKFLLEENSTSGSVEGAGGEELDELFEEARDIVLKERKTSISYLQRRLQIGYNRAARIVEQLEQIGVLSPPNAKGNRDILV
ncbi:DNA translocase FtsK 4TM domain-containing protein [Nitrosophilus alvini]|uniref:DNA translocase FtsK n=1 Tax=Nitrosophilus alvini TaxID=2714855 RepID=UPI003B835DD3